MLFSSPIFVFLFLPFFLLIYHALPAKQLIQAEARLGWRNRFLFVASLLFYAWGEGLVVIVLLSSAAINYIAGLLIAHSYRKWGLYLSLIGSLSLLFYYKYANFTVDSASQLAHYLGASTEHWQSVETIALPIGISFYTFQGISYVLDVYWDRIDANRNFIDYGTYVAMFPHQIAGPIVRYADIAGELTNRHTTFYSFSLGIERFIIGLAKKVLLANSFARVADTVFDTPVDAMSTSTAWLGIIAYSLQIYFDFSGYSDMAIGLGKLIGFDFKENFNYPYTAQSIQDFWRRWHISLSSWFRDYLYVPLGGSRGTAAQTYRNLLVVFFVTGLWHGASWNFIVWGLFHGSFLLVERAGLANWLKRVPWPVRHVYTLLIVVVGWVFFRADDLGSAVAYLGRMTGIGQITATWTVYPISYLLTAPQLGTFLMGGLLATPFYHWWKSQWQRLLPVFWRDIGYMIGLFGLFIITITYLAASTYNPFIYFRF
ncbi:membrane bound O-acyl transferase MBOAT family protein [Fibrella aestuarina BUZ 2]|uniref:Membrane bound O-acyl transferase MBOAT family protein n=1 Tax=Fibrella aestuarina BUZ 2 TaxID=1166018 RepID=I0KE47_9BACT|nr:MBOAT family O-acyltransferase [Fibrella aestuarina]CCH02400.1 membrane bound O-acyl transferase MBOAT family protein [Fibrella aestuarina BUZ 2]